MKRGILILFLLVFTKTVSTQNLKVDYRYSPQWWVSCIGLPDDSCKTLVGPLGQLLYEFGGEDFFPYIGAGQGFRTVVQTLADENIKINNQRLYSARVPIVITESTYDGLNITQESFALGMNFIRNQISTKEGKREDVILTTVDNPTEQTRTIKPVLIINSEHPMEVDEGRLVINKTIQIITDLKTTRVRKNLGDSKTVINLEEITLAPGDKKQYVVLYDNGMSSDIVDGLKAAPKNFSSKVERLKAEVINYWEEKSSVPYNHITVPDTEIQNLLDASIRGIWQAREIKNNKIAFQVGPTCYRGLWIVDGAFILETAAMFDRGLDARAGIDYTLSFQKETGEFAIMDKYYKENGFVLWTCVRHALLTQDKAWLHSVWPQLIKTMDFIKVLRARTYETETPLDDGLIPPGTIDGGLWGGPDMPEYTNVYWSLVGIKSMVQAAHWLGEKKIAEVWEKEYSDMYSVFKKAAQRDKQIDNFGNVYLPIPMEVEKQSLPQRAQWAFCLAIYPGQIFEKDDPIVLGTMDMLHTTLQEGMVMGTGWEINGIWNYFAGFYGQACLWIGKNQYAVESLYAFANHASPLYNWREEHNPRDLTPSKYVGDMPHNWASAEFIGLTVHMLALDRGSELHLLQAIPESWLQPSMKTAMKDIATPFGKLTFTLQVDKIGKTASLDIENLSDPSCKGIWVHLSDWGVYKNDNIVNLDSKRSHSIVIDIIK